MNKSSSHNRKILEFSVGYLENAPAELDPQREISAKDLARCSTSGARQLLKKQDAELLSALPLAVITQGARSTVYVAASNNDPQTVQALQFAIGKEVQLLLASSRTVQEALFLAYHGEKATTVSENNEKQVASFLQELLEDAIVKESSDIHLLPLKRSAQIRLRVQGILEDYRVVECSKEFLQEVINRIKVLACLNYHERELPQDGAFDLSLHHREYRIRVSTLPTVSGEKVVLRLPSRREYGDLPTLGLSQFTQKNLEKKVHRAHGALIFCGATGSGKTTTMHTLVEPFVKEKHVVTIEDPIEYELSGATQVSVSEKHGRSYAPLLRAVLRQDPEIVVLGEVRDKESASTAIQAAITGHLLLTTVHARNVFEAFLRFKEFGVDSLSMAQGVAGVVCQKLIRRLCLRCRIVDLTSTRKVEHTIYQANGCSHCGYTGYSGRMLMEESLFPDSALRSMLYGGDYRPEVLSSILNERSYWSIMQSIELGLRSGMLDVKTVKMVID
ncbi:MAG: type II/IV secretion system protein [Bdellovibrionales bacterium]|nr:type II/IV secretion system protein [Bdellovibrionales bacterium]